MAKEKETGCRSQTFKQYSWLEASLGALYTISEPMLDKEKLIWIFDFPVDY